MIEILSDELIKQYTAQQQIGIWKTHHTMLVFESNYIISSSKIAAFDMEGTLINTNPNNNSDWLLLNSFVSSRLQDLHSSGYEIVIFVNQVDLCMNNDTSKVKSQSQWQLKIEMIFIALKVPIQLFTSTCNDEYRKPRTAMWRDFIWLLTDGINIDYKASFYVSKNKKENFSDINIHFAAHIPLSCDSSEQQFTNDSSNITMKHFNVIQTVRISNMADAVWRLMSGFFYIHKWHPQISAIEEIDDEQPFIEHRVIFVGEMIDTIEQLQVLDNHNREYQYKNMGGN
jgi:DNA 3'-phosphatase